MGRAVPDGRLEAIAFGSDPWRLTAANDAVGLAHVPAIFTLGNGFIGARGRGGTAGEPRVFLNGVFDRVAILYHEAAFGYARQSDTRLSVADATLPAITVDGRLLGNPTRIELDMRRGVRIDHFVAEGIAISVEQLISMTRQAVVALRIGFPGAAAGRIAVEPAILPPAARMSAPEDPLTYDPRVSPQLVKNPWREDHCEETPRHHARVDVLTGSGFAVAAACAVTGVVQTGERACIDTFASYVATRRGGPLPEALAELSDARATGFDTLAQEQAAWFGEHWRTSGTAFPKAPRAEQALHHAQFQLVQAVGRNGITSIAAKGQTGEGYEGHVFWDADLYVLPMYAFTRPEIARAMLVWRISGLEGARANARAMGQARGALYPWRTIAGRECSSFFPAGSAQYHINADIAFALRTYLDATGDTTILAEGGAEMLVETARVWSEVGHHDPTRDDAFVINRVTGPDEYTAIVDNNLYTNMMAAEHLRDAARVGLDAGLIDADEATGMRTAAEKMFLPFDEKRRVFAQDDAFFGKQPWPFSTTASCDYPLLLHHHPLKIYRHRVAKQADAVLALALLRDRFEPAMRARMLDEYEAVTVHDSTLSASVFAIVAANIGDVGRAWRYWRSSLLTDLCDLHGNTDHGLHMAAMAGAWNGIALGFAGMRVLDGQIGFRPIAVPELGEYSFTICFRGSVVTMSVDETVATYCVTDGPDLTILHDEVAVAIGRQSVRLALAR